MTGKEKPKRKTRTSNSSGATKKKSPAKRSGEPVKIRELNTKVTTLTESNRQLKRKIFDLYTIFEISRNFNAVLHFETLLDTFILTSMAQVGASKAALFLPTDEKPDHFILQHSKGITGLKTENAVFEAGTDLLDMLTRISRPEPTGELLDGKMSVAEKKLLHRFHPGLVVPLLYQGRLSGIFVIGDKMSNRAFQLDDIEFLSILGSQISVAIENARLYRAEMTATRQLREAQEQLVHSERLAALGEMSAKVAHEINNPLGIIKNYVLLVKRAIGNNKEASNYIDVVREEIFRIARIVQELLDFTRPRQSMFTAVNVAQIVDDVLGLMERQIKSQNVQVLKEFADGPSIVNGAGENLKQVFMNLIINALDALEGRGEIKVRVFSENGNVIVRCCDSGPGIEPEIIPHIFEPFFTTKDPGKGTGLGLSVCYGIVKRHGGSISYRNLDHGGCFEIRLPAVAEEAS